MQVAGRGTYLWFAKPSQPASGGSWQSVRAVLGDHRYTPRPASHPSLVPLHALGRRPLAADGAYLWSPGTGPFGPLGPPRVGVGVWATIGRVGRARWACRFGVRRWAGGIRDLGCISGSTVSLVAHKLPCHRGTPTGHFPGRLVNHRYTVSTASARAVVYPSTLRAGGVLHQITSKGPHRKAFDRNVEHAAAVRMVCVGPRGS